MTEKAAKWTFELKSGRGSEVTFVIKSDEGDVVAQSVPFVDLTSANKAIGFIKEYCAEFEVHTVPG